MFGLVPMEPVDYLVIGHVTEDLTPDGPRLGGTAAFSALTARALGLRVGVVTAVRAGLLQSASGWSASRRPAPTLEALEGVQVVSIPSEHTTTFENTRTLEGRVQTLHHQAAAIALEAVPDVWRKAAIVHLGPVAQELDPKAAGHFSASVLGITPQGWMRTWDGSGRVSACKWESAGTLLPQAGAVVISREDVGGDEELIESMAHQTRLLAVTEGAAGSVLYWNGDRRRFRAPEVTEVDSTGAGDIFAAALFVRLYTTRDPWEAARFATRLASYSVTRVGLSGIPTRKEVEESTMVISD